MKNNSLVIIPTLNPDETLLDYVDHLLEDKVKKILVINDGSEKEKDYIF